MTLPLLNVLLAFGGALPMAAALGLSDYSCTEDRNSRVITPSRPAPHFTRRVTRESDKGQFYMYSVGLVPNASFLREWGPIPNAIGTFVGRIYKLVD